MNLGWSDGGHGRLRASDADRDEVRQLLGVARDEGRLDEVEYDQRVGAVRAAKTRADLVRVTGDLPDREGVRDWAPRMRVRGADREDGGRWLAEAAAEGRLSDEEYQGRLLALSTVATYEDLAILLDGVRGAPGTARSDWLAGSADREAALAALAAAAGDGRVAPVEAPALEADVRRARRIADLDALLAALERRVSDQERQATVDALAGAHHEGQLGVAEYAARAGQAREAARDADLAPLVADLRGGARRLTESDRQAATATLTRALEEGRLDLAEFDERVRAVHAAASMADIGPLLADLASPPRPARRGWTDALFDLVVANSALISAPRRRIVTLAWKAATGGTVLGYAYFVAREPLIALVACWPVLLGMLFAQRVLARALAGPAKRRQQAVVDELRRRVNRLLPKKRRGAERIELDYPFHVGVARIEFPNRWVAPSDAREEVVKLLWLSRLYPLREIWFAEPYAMVVRDRVRLKGAEAQRLRHRYGPRPYGPFPDDEVSS